VATGLAANGSIRYLFAGLVSDAREATRGRGFRVVRGNGDKTPSEGSGASSVQGFWIFREKQSEWAARIITTGLTDDEKPMPSCAGSSVKNSSPNIKS
jgi:hypothetical protein